MLIKNDIFLRAARGEQTERPPVWLMRQAGRILASYRELRGKLSGFKELVETPELACEVTLQPIDELGVDAAIIFSDILVIPEALGLSYQMEEKKGPSFAKTIENQQDITQLLTAEDAAARLDYVYKALDLTKKTLNGRVPLIGFAGAPFTIFAYMVEGGGSKTFSKAKKMMYQQPEMAHQLLQKITDTTILYLKKQIASGADLIQVFDSWAGVLSPVSFTHFSLFYMTQIVKAIQPLAPITLFAKDAAASLLEIKNTGCNIIGLGWGISANESRELLGKNTVLQGNLDPCALYADTKTVQKMTKQMLADFGQHHICNLGHGVYPDTPLDSVKAFIDTAQQFYY
jgi:uroporphyrinogen decarboxylase